jgi:hypothetical protein
MNSSRKGKAVENRTDVPFDFREELKPELSAQTDQLEPPESHESRDQRVQELDQVNPVHHDEDSISMTSEPNVLIIQGTRVSELS